MQVDYCFEAILSYKYKYFHWDFNKFSLLQKSNVIPFVWQVQIMRVRCSDSLTARQCAIWASIFVLLQIDKKNFFNCWPIVLSPLKLLQICTCVCVFIFLFTVSFALKYLLCFRRSYLLIVDPQFILSLIKTQLSRTKENTFSFLNTFALLFRSF